MYSQVNLEMQPRKTKTKKKIYHTCFTVRSNNWIEQWKMRSVPKIDRAFLMSQKASVVWS